MEGNKRIRFRYPDGLTRYEWATRQDNTRSDGSGPEGADGLISTPWKSRYEVRVEAIRNGALDVTFIDENGTPCTVALVTESRTDPNTKVYIFVDRPNRKF